jgi:hypothetical protein
MSIGSGRGILSLPPAHDIGPGDGASGERLTPDRLPVILLLTTQIRQDIPPPTTDGISLSVREIIIVCGGEEVSMKKISCVLLAAAILWVFLALLATGTAKIMNTTTSRGYSWVSKEELRSLARYHGTEALKITALDVSIWRDGEWIRVLKNKKI